MKTCATCQQDKVTGDFHKNRIHADGLHPVCKGCRYADYQKKKVKRAPGNRAYSAQYRAKNKDKVRDQALKANFGITLAQYNQMLNRQKGVCKICEKPEITKNRALAVDHCHATGKIRGLLCSNCNRAIGLLRDDINLVQKTVAYLVESA